MSKKILSMLLASLILCGTTACSGETDEKETETDTSVQTDIEVVESDEPQLELPDMDFEGADIHFLGTDGLGGYYVTDDIWSEGLDGSAMNDAIFQRNDIVITNYNFNLTYDSSPDAWRSVGHAVRSGDDIADIMFINMLFLVELIPQSFMYNLSELDYLDLEKPWWDQRQIQQTSIAKKTFFLTGELTTCDNAYTFLTFFNKTLLEKHNIELPYDLVKEGNWTFDVFVKMGEAVYEDVNGNGELDEEDVVGICQGQTSGLADGLGYIPVILDKEGKPTDVFMNETTVDILTLAASLLDTPNVVLPQSKMNLNGVETYIYERQLFRNGSVLFDITGVGAGFEFREMEDDYGLVPYPKASPEQENYYCWVDNCIAVACVPVTVKDPNRSAFIMEAMAYESVDTVTVTYNETICERRFTRDAESAEMLDIINESRLYSYKDWFSVTGFPSAGNESAVVSRYEANRENIAKQLEDRYEKYLELK